MKLLNNPKSIYLLFFVFIAFSIFNNLSAQTLTDPQKEIIYISPQPGSRLVTPQSNIIIRFSEKISPFINSATFFNVYGAVSGKHSGKIILAEDQTTLLFNPDQPFAYNEKVTVNLNNSAGALNWHNSQLSKFNFYTSKNNLNALYKPKLINESEIISNWNSGNFTQKPSEQMKLNKNDDLPSDFPVLTVDTSNNPSSGYLFLAAYVYNTNSPYGRYLIIADNNGTPLYYKKTSSSATDFKVQPSGVLSYFAPSAHQYYIMNTSFKIIDSVSCKNGYSTDAHELRITTDGHYYLLGTDVETVDMSQVVSGGDSAAQVTGNIIQELDQNKNVVFQWRTFDYFKITDAVGINLTTHTIDYAHANALDIDTDGNLLLSCRNMNEITKIDTSTGDIIWRFGGKNNHFTFVNDTLAFTYQHAIRRLPNGDLTIFDDGNLHTPTFSRAVEYKLNESDSTATLVWQYRNNPDIYGFAMGYVQRLNNGNTLIGWGAANKTLTEVTPSGNITLAMNFPLNVWSYRAYRFPFLFIDSTLAGNVFAPQDSAEINWQSSGIDSVNIYYSTDNGNSWNTIVNNYVAAKGSYKWYVPSVESDQCKIKIVNADAQSWHNTFKSDSTFTIGNPTGISSETHPQEYSLSANYPNPFNPSTTISYTLPVTSNVKIRVYNLIGQLVAVLVNTVKPAGNHNVVFDASDLSSGVYFDAIDAISVNGKRYYSTVNKMVLIK